MPRRLRLRQTRSHTQESFPSLSIALSDQKTRRKERKEFSERKRETVLLKEGIQRSVCQAIARVFMALAPTNAYNSQRPSSASHKLTIRRRHREQKKKKNTVAQAGRHSFFLSFTTHLVTDESRALTSSPLTCDASHLPPLAKKCQYYSSTACLGPHRTRGHKGHGITHCIVGGTPPTTLNQMKSSKLHHGRAWAALAFFPTRPRGWGGGGGQRAASPTRHG